MMVDKDKVEVQCVPIPFPKPSQLLLEVASAGLNPVDWKVVSYNFFGWKMPHAVGTDVAGHVRQTGSEVKEFKRGDRVVASLNLASMGAFAEYAVAEAHCSANCGAMNDMDVAGCLPVAFLSAYEMFLLAPVKALMEKKNAKPTIFIPGGGGGVGHMAVGLAKHYGFEVISTGSRAETLAVIKAAGAHHIIDYKKENVVDAVKKIAPEGVDMIYDSSYQATSYVEAAKVLKAKGVYCVLGGVPDAKSEQATIVAAKEGVIVNVDLVPYSTQGSKEVQSEHIGKGLAAAAKLVGEGHFNPHISKRYPLAEISEALASVKKGAFSGKVIMSMKH
jgi:NADPH:quinone reductase-like Zn-dependent oxidoreductase